MFNGASNRKINTHE